MIDMACLDGELAPGTPVSFPSVLELLTVWATTPPGDLTPVFSLAAYTASSLNTEFSLQPQNFLLHHSSTPADKLASLQSLWT